MSGGQRPGSGRKKKGSNVRVSLSVRVSPATMEALERVAQEDGISLGEAVDKAVLEGLPIEEPWMEPCPPMEEPFEEPVEEPVEVPIEEPVEVPMEEPIEEPVEKPVEEPVEVPIEEPVEVPMEEPVEVPMEEPIEEPVEVPIEVAVEEPIEAAPVMPAPLEFNAWAGHDMVQVQVTPLEPGIEEAIKAALEEGGSLKAVPLVKKLKAAGKVSLKVIPIG